MDVRCNWVAVAEHLGGTEPPVFVLERPPPQGKNHAHFASAEVARVGEFWVALRPALVGGDSQWTVTRAGDFVRVPVHADRTVHRSPAAVFGLGLQIGLAVMADLQQVTRDKPTQLTLVLGDQCTDLYPEEAYRCYVGIAIRTK